MPASFETSWKILRKLGEGGQGTTHEVQLISDSAVRGVLKLLKHGSDAQARSRMAIEAINLHKLGLGTVKVPKVLEENTREYLDPSIELYLIMEFVNGKTLDRAVTDHGGRLSLEASVALALDLCETISAMHKLDVLHRDLKPANLMVRDLDRTDIVVLDFGLSYDRQQKGDSVTRTGENIKNELLVLPEANTPAGDRRDARSDITNIVAVFFYCLTGNLPRLLVDEKNRLPHQREGLRPREVLAGDPRASQVELLFDSGLANDIDSRFQSIDELRQRLGTVLKGTGSNRKSALLLDKELGAGIRKRSRAVQIQEMMPAAQTVSRLISAAINRISSAVSTFTVTLTGPLPNEASLPTGIDPVLPQLVSPVVGVKGHAENHIVGLAIGAKGEQCVLLRSGIVKSIQGRITPAQHWHEVAWFSTVNPPTEDIVMGWADELIGMLMEAANKSIA